MTKSMISFSCVVSILVWLIIVLSTSTAFVVVQRPTLSTSNNRYAAAAATTTTTRSSTFLNSISVQKVFVAGGTRGTGRLIIDEVLKQLPLPETDLVDVTDDATTTPAPTTTTTRVVALVRNPTDAESLNAIPGVTAIVGDAMDQKTVENAMDGCDAAITTLGGSGVNNDLTIQERVDYVGNNNVIESAGILGVTRVLLVTSVGCGSSKVAAPPQAFEVLKHVLAAKEKAENVLIKYYTNTNWTIIRPGGLKSEPPTGQAILTEDDTAIGSIHRADLASLVVQAMLSPKTERKILTAVDPTVISAASVEGKTVEAFALV